MKKKNKFNVMTSKKKSHMVKVSGKASKANKKNGKVENKKSKSYGGELLGKMTVDEFFSKGIVQSDDTDEEESVVSIDSTRHVETEDTGCGEELMQVDGAPENHEDGESGMSESKLHKKSLAELQKTDPEFYSFLKSNDEKLLRFDLSDSESEVYKSDNEDDGNNFHQPPDKLEVASDDSENEAVDHSGLEHKVTLKMVKCWQEHLQLDTTAEGIRTVTKAFHAALQTVSAEKKEAPEEFKVDDSSVFNAVIQLCVLDLQPALKKFLRITGDMGHVQPSKCKKWVKIRNIVKMYLDDLLQLLNSVSSPHILVVLLKHLHQMIPFLLGFRTLSKAYLKKLINFWSSGEETVRVIAFLCILRLSTSRHSDLLPDVLKKMYIAYVNNCKFVSPNTLSGINFMRRSLAEVYALDESASYQHVFLYVRQLAIHLRNAITVKKKEHHQAVYNWQFVHSLHLWAELLGTTSNKPQLQPLMYPLVQVIIGTVKLTPTIQYCPLRFHCVQMLIQLSKSSGVYIPVLPFLLEILNTYDFNKRHKKVSMKPLDLTCMLRASKLQLQENSFKDAVIEKIYQQILECLTIEAHRIGFPDMVIPVVIQMKSFLKICKVANYAKKMKQLLDKIEENARFVENERSKISFSLTDRKSIDAWETVLREKGVPLLTYYNSWNKLHVQQMAKRMTQNDKLGDFNIPVLKKFEKKRNENRKTDGPVELFPSDDSEDDGTLPALTPSVKKKDNKKKKDKIKTKEQERTNDQNEEPDVKVEEGEEPEDIIEELTLSDLE